MPYCTRRSGFTLLEMSIVIVVIAVLIGGLFLGQNLVTAANIRAVVADAEQFTHAANSFRDKYDAFPGDMPNAESFWGSDAACPNTPTNDEPKKATCNGNGNDRVGDFPGAYADEWEWYRFWQHLANAEMIEGSYTGVSGTRHATLDWVGGLNVPKGPVRRSRWVMMYFDLWGVVPYYQLDYQNTLTLDSDEPLDTPVIGGGYPTLTTAEAYAVDSKLDDGRPGQGKIGTLPPAAGWLCATDDDPLLAEYDLEYTEVACGLYFTRFLSR